MAAALPEPSLELDLQRARAAVLLAENEGRASDRYLAGHAAALRVAAVVLALRTHPVLGGRASRPRNAWHLLAEVAPELAEWAAFFAAAAAKRDAVRAGATAIVTSREADDLVRDAERFLSVVEQAVGPRWQARTGRALPLPSERVEPAPVRSLHLVGRG
ncbi:MAG: hypothetical protein JWP61_1403 [Friedmanniella sp.]|nr:hypothetical protein [Friedmanniella sp.]